MRFISLLVALLLVACDSQQSTSTEESLALASNDAGPSLEVLATGANIAGANGMYFGPDGLLYVASVTGSDLTVLNPDSGEEVRRFTAADGVIGPDDVAFASDGSFYWTSIRTGEVAGFDVSGNKVIAAQLPPGPNPITFSDDDRLFVSQCFLGTNVYELDPMGMDEPRLIADDLGPGCGLNGMDWGPDGRLYGPRWFVGEVVSLDVETGQRRVEATGFMTPASVKFNSQGELHVLDTGAGSVLRVNGDENEVVATLTPGLDNFAFDENDTIFVSSFIDGFVKRVNADGSLTTLQPEGMAHPGGVAVIGDIVWVSDTYSIRGFDRDSGEEVVTQRNVLGVGEMGVANNLSAMGSRLILISAFDGHARVWDPETQSAIETYSNLAGPVAAVSYRGGIAITEQGKGSITLYGPTEPIILASDLPQPTGLLVSDNDLYVSDRALGQILRIASAGEALSEPSVVLDGLDSPEGFLSVNGEFVIVEADGSRLVAVDVEGNRRVLADINAGSGDAGSRPPTQIFNGVAMDADGDLYVTGERSRELYRIQAPW